MFIAKLENGTVTTVGDYRELFPNTCFSPFGPDDAWFEENQCKRVNLFKAYNALMEKLVPCAPYVEGDWVFTVEVQPLSDEEKEAQSEAKKAQVRAERNQKLSDCDWTQLGDSPVDKQAWAAYRQSLRDITSQEGFPGTVEWPRYPGQPDLQQLV
jgi:hypothetical protein